MSMNTYEIVEQLLDEEEASIALAHVACQLLARQDVDVRERSLAVSLKNMLYVAGFGDTLHIVEGDYE